MTKMRLGALTGVAVAVAVAVAVFMVAGPASAQASRTWVSGVGDDANPCSRTAPCKTFAGAISKTLACGEIDALDPGGFGAVTITKGITIDGGGGQVASILVSGTPGITINDLDQTCTRVIIRNIQFQGLAPSVNPVAGTNGINIIKGNVVLEHIKVQNFSNDCVNYQPAQAQQLTIINSDFVGCANAGIEVSDTTGAAGAQASASITGSTFEQNGIGVSALKDSFVAIHDSMLSGNTTGLQSSGVNAIAFMDTSSSTNNSSADVYATNNGKIGIAANSVTDTNGFGLKRDTGGTIASFSNNWVQFVTSNNAPSSTVAPE